MEKKDEDDDRIHHGVPPNQRPDALVEEDLDVNEGRKGDSSTRTSSYNELEVQDVTDLDDEGYEADIERVYPDGYEEPSETEADDSTSIFSVNDQESQRHKNLIRHFKALRCGSRSKASRAFDWRTYSRGSLAVKRSHSEDSLTDTDEDDA